MSNTKKLLAVVIILSIAAAMTACGNTGGAKDTGGNNPVSEKGLTDLKTQDLNGKKVGTSLFEKNKYTLVDIWGTYCNPCIDSMPELEKLHQEYRDKGIGVVGIVIDAQDQSLKANNEQVEFAKTILKEQGATYPNMLMSDSIVENVVQYVDAVPTAFFVNSQGEVVTELYKGKRSYEDWVNVIEKELSN